MTRWYIISNVMWSEDFEPPANADAFTLVYKDVETAELEWPDSEILVVESDEPGSLTA